MVVLEDIKFTLHVLTFLGYGPNLRKDHITPTQKLEQRGYMYVGYWEYVYVSLRKQIE